MLRRTFCAGILVGLTACKRAYYDALEKVGVQKRELLVQRVDKAKESQQEAKEQFRDALAAFSAVTGYDGGELEQLQDDLEQAYERSESRADEVRDGIDAVDDVARALFDEWEDELDDYDSQSLRSKSERQLREAQRRYDGMFAAMQRAQSKMDPVLEAMQDQVLFLQHNLNARAIASLDQNVEQVRAEVEALIVDMEKAIEEAEAFMAQMNA